jgi:glycosyltransferase involved in cell wall biosynthesis
VPTPIPRPRPRLAGVTWAYPPIVGGVERYAYIGMKAAMQWAETRVFTAADGSRASSDIEIPGEPPVERLPAHRLFGDHVLSLRHLFAALRRFDPDLIWTQHPSIGTDLAAVYAILNGRPWVATYHADLAPWKPYARPFAAWEAWLMRRAQRVIVTSDGYADRLARRGIRRERIHVIPCAPWIGYGVLPLPLETEVGPDAQLGPDHPLLFVAALDWSHDYKQPQLLLQALAALKNDNLPLSAVFVGDGDRRTSLEEDARRLQLDRQVRFVGRVDDAALASWYRKSWALVLPSDSETEGFGTVCVEAVQYGCPVVTDDHVPAGSLLSARGAGLTHQRGDPHGLIRVIRQIATEPGLRARLSVGARASAPEFEWPRIRAATTRVLQGACGEPPTRGGA